MRSEYMRDKFKNKIISIFQSYTVRYIGIYLKFLS